MLFRLHKLLFEIEKFGKFNCGDPWENRTPVTAVKGRCLSRLTNGPDDSADSSAGPIMVAEVGLEPTTYRV